ncbi:MAG: acetylglutamate kinase, partial [Flavobacteriaceae bacterium]|nr:acetylglutamate kinase [Flavobacteriaceae bacterium]
MKLQDQNLSQLSPDLKRNLLIEALSYIKDFQNQIVVIKYGGAAMIQEEFKKSFSEDIVLLHSLGLRPVIVHGGGPEVSKAIKLYGHKSSFIDGLRITDLLSLKISEMVLSGFINKEIVTHINTQSGKAVGLSGKDGKLLTAKKFNHPTTDLGYVGEVDKVNPELILSLIDDGYIPVLSPIGMSDDGQTYNINADTFASHIASALKAQKLIFLTNVKGILKDEKLISILDEKEVMKLIDDKSINGGMVPKVKGMIYGLNKGVETVHIISGIDKHAIIS